MKFCELERDEFRAFSEGHEQETFFQTVENADLRASYGSIIHYLGVKKDDVVVAAAMFTETPCMFGKSKFYAPYGILIDYHDFELLKFYTEGLKNYCKKHNALFARFDPNVVYVKRDADGKIIEGSPKEDGVISSLKKLGYHHFGFTKDYRFTQSRWNFRIHLDIPYEELKKRFSKSTRKNIEHMYEKGVRIRRGKKEDMPVACRMFRSSAERKHFDHLGTNRDVEYYERMYDYYKDLMETYIAYVDTTVYLEHVQLELKKEEEKKQEILEKMKKDMVGQKLKSGLATSEERLIKLQEELKYAEELKKKNPNGVDVGALISIRSGKEYVSLVSGILGKYKKFMPKYVMYNEHILDAYKMGLEYVNFFGCGGKFDKSSLIYGVYEFKRGFSGEVQELIGEFNLPCSLAYYIYHFLRRMKIIYRVMTKK